MNEVRIATRRSALAMAQAKQVAHLILERHPDTPVRRVEVVTEGDLDKTSDITTLTEIGAFVTAVQEAVMEGRADLAVHSLKDLPVVSHDDLVIAAFPERVSPYDVLVGRNLDEMTAGSTIGTGSPRRSAQLKELRPDLSTVALRGNVDTRVRKVTEGEVDGAVLAEAGLDRLGMTDRIARRFTAEEMVPAPGQGALAIETRPDTEAREIAATINDPGLRPLLAAERELLAQTQAGCRSALGALATWDGDLIRMDLFVSDERGPRRATVTGDDVDGVVAAGRAELGL